MDSANFAGSNEPVEERYFDYLYTAEKMHSARTIFTMAGYLPAIPAAYFVWSKAKNKAWWAAWGAVFIGLGWLVRQNFNHKVELISKYKPGFAEFFQEWLGQGDKEALRQGLHSSPALAAIVAASFAEGGEAAWQPRTGFEEGKLRDARRGEAEGGEGTANQTKAAEAIYNKQMQALMGVIVCPNCKMKVFPRTDGTCPSCREMVCVIGSPGGC